MEPLQNFDTDTLCTRLQFLSSEKISPKKKERKKERKKRKKLTEEEKPILFLRKSEKRRAKIYIYGGIFALPTSYRTTESKRLLVQL